MSFKTFFLSMIIYLAVIPFLAPSMIVKPLLLEHSLGEIVDLVDYEISDGIYQIEADIVYHPTYVETVSKISGYVGNNGKQSFSEFLLESIHPDQLIVNLSLPFASDSEKASLLSRNILNKEKPYFKMFLWNLSIILIYLL